jgi:hypothetical protein
MSFARCKAQTHRQPVGVDHCMNLARHSASRPTHGLSFVSSNAGCVLMHAHNGRVDHLDGRIMIGSKYVHDPLPYSGPSPPDEAVVAGGAWTVTIRQIAPWCAGSQHPADTVRDTSIVYTRHASHLVWQHRLDGCPFIIREFAAHDSRLQLGSLNRVQSGAIHRQSPDDSFQMGALSQGESMTACKGLSHFTRRALSGVTPVEISLSDQTEKEIGKKPT